jgi:ribosome-binding protein aMBF1 (putative translation factor)
MSDSLSRRHVLAGATAAIIGAALPAVFTPRNRLAVAIGRRLRQAREAVGMSIDDVAPRLAVMPAVVTAWEDGKYEPKAKQAYKLIKLYRVDWDWLIND